LGDGGATTVIGVLGARVAFPPIFAFALIAVGLVFAAINEALRLVHGVSANVGARTIVDVFCAVCASKPCAVTLAGVCTSARITLTACAAVHAWRMCDYIAVCLVRVACTCIGIRVSPPSLMTLTVVIRANAIMAVSVATINVFLGTPTQILAATESTPPIIAVACVAAICGGRIAFTVTVAFCCTPIQTRILALPPQISICHILQ
jgi:hypothetical protein